MNNISNKKGHNQRQKKDLKYRENHGQPDAIKLENLGQINSQKNINYCRMLKKK